MEKTELEEKIWYRFFKVLFWVFAVLAMVTAFYIAQGFANEKTKVLDKVMTYETLGLAIKENNPDSQVWDTTIYPSLTTASNQEIGKAFYEDRFKNKQFSKIWANKEQGEYEFFIEMDKNTFLEKVMLYLRYLGGTLFALFTLRLIGRYVLTGKKR